MAEDREFILKDMDVQFKLIRSLGQGKQGQVWEVEVLVDKSGPKGKILTNSGPYLQEFENKLKSLTGIKHVICVSNGTIALQLAIKMLGLKGEVITSPFSFVATSSAIIWENCTPVYADIDTKSLNLDPNKAEQKINSLQENFNNNIVTEIKKATEFYIAEEYHQEYVAKGGICHF